MIDRRVVPALVLFLAVACAEQAPPPPPTTVAAVAATTLPATVVGTALATVPTFEVRAENGRALRVPVSVAVTSGGGTLTGAPTRSERGPTPIGTWTLGATAGTQTLSVTVEGLTPLVFTVEGIAGAATAMSKVGTPDLRAPENGVVPVAIQVRLVDGFGNGVPNATVNWAVTAGGGLLAASASVSNADGVATAPAWTLGLEAAGAQSLSATAGALTQSFSAVVQAAAASITVETAPPASHAAGVALATAPTFAVRDAEGNILNGIPVTVAVTAGNGSLTGAPTSTAPTPTAIGAWTLDQGLGTNSVTISVAGLPSEVLTVQGVAGPIANLSVTEGSGQRALAGEALANPVRVRAADQFDNPVAAAQVSWNVLAGAGSLAAGMSLTDGSGVATMPAWTLGVAGGPQQLQATAGGAGLFINAEIQSDYALELRWNGGPPGGDIQAAFENAAARIRAGIVGQMSGVAFTSFNANACVSGLTLNETISGLVIYATVETIDGPGMVLGSAGPCYLRNSNQLTVVGRMRFDVADLENLSSQGRLEAVILHEMLHVIGVGTLWVTKGLRLGEAPASTPRFTGPLAQSACINDHAGAVFCATGVPAEDCIDAPASCGGGTINSHWKESVFRTELMTGYLSAGSNPFSKMTLQSLADLGYTVNLNIQNPYTVPGAGLMSFEPAWSLKMPDPHGPLASVDAGGRVVQRYRSALPDHE